MGRSQRQKGARGERDLRDLFMAHGFQARRDGRLDDDLVHDLPGVHVECKRRETLAIPAWLRQTILDARGRVPALFFRRSREPWWVVVPADHYLELQARVRGLSDALTAGKDHDG